MNRRTRRVGAALVGLTLGAAACSDQPDGAANGSEPPIGLSDNALRFVLDKYAVPPGDSFECFFTDVVTDRELFVNRATGKQGSGGHHVTIYYNDGPVEPVGHHPCKEEEMAKWNQVGGAGNEGAGVADLPPGVALKVPQGKQFVVQTHYINATSKSHDEQDEITIHLLKPNEVKSYANSFVLIDSAFDVPPQSSQYKRTSTCVVQEDVDLVVLLGHMHEAGSHYTLESIDDRGNTLETLLDHDWEPSYAAHPPSKHWTPDAPYRLAKGTRLRQTCAWKNSGSESLRFPREMCLAFSYYLNDHGFIMCNGVPAPN